MLRAFHILVVVLLWACTAYRVMLLVRRPSRSFGNAAVCLALLFLALGFTIGLPPLYLRIPLFAEGASLVRIVQHGLIVISLFWLNVFVAHSGSRSKAGIVARAVTAAVALGSMIVLFWLANPGDDAEDFVGAYADMPFVTEYLLVYLGYMAFVLVDVYRLTRQFAGSAPDGPMRFALRLWSLSSLIGFAYAAHKAAYALMSRLGVQLPWWEGAVSTSLGGTVLVFFVVGLTSYVWGPRIVRATQLRQQRRRYRELLPLWRACYDVMPEIALVPPGERVPIDLRVYRCVIEILDGRLALRAYWDTGIAERDGEAAAMAAALAAKSRDEPVQAGPAALRPLDVVELTEVARAFRTLSAAGLPAPARG
ncbi:MAB_1171c family putative transporter [Lentzea sp. JNUCC 0626]|uniref:MAB_1171c family putative transporter n=1 Tax=Lentzea sp. JNUCC 0626 TaxID=3367513 RepID=UPI003748D715